MTPRKVLATYFSRHRRPRPIDTDKLMALWPTRMPMRQLARELGHHHAVLRKKAYKLGLPQRQKLWGQQ